MARLLAPRTADYRIQSVHSGAKQEAGIRPLTPDLAESTILGSVHYVRVGGRYVEVRRCGFGDEVAEQLLP